MRCSKAPGFTFTEAMVSVAILGIIAVSAGYSLRTSRMRDELRTAGRVLAADLRSAQARAIAAQNLKFCQYPLGRNISCENSSAACVTACTASPASGVGLHIIDDSGIYTMFAKLDPNTTDWRESYPEERFLTRDFSKSGATNVTVSSLQSLVAYGAIDVAFQRQNGNMRIDACSVGCTNASWLNITLQHSRSLKTLVVSVNQITGRISIEE